MAPRRQLQEYRDKRDFELTPEPSGAERPEPAESPRFVVQEHHATALHWDLRLEAEGVLWSWAVPKGIPADPKHNHLAVRTEDHPLKYLEFSGDIPEGNYGAGQMTIWDRGTYELHKQNKREVVITLHGQRVSGRYALFQTNGKNWMIHRVDPPTDPERQDPPADLRPMLATLAELPKPPSGWAFEVKWDGIRALATVQGGRLQLASRNGRDLSSRYPELRAMGHSLGSTEVVLDGEVVAFDEEGRPSFQLLQRRMHVTSESAQRRFSQDSPVTYMVFDVLWLDGHLLVDLPYRERRERLEALGLNGPAWRTPPVAFDDPSGFMSFVQQAGLEGVVAKRVDSPYEIGRRSASWRKIKLHQRQEFLVGGWSPGKGNRSGRIGALLLGYYDHPGGSLQYAGKVGTGFTVAELDRLERVLAPLVQAENPFESTGVPRDATFVRPELVVEVRYGEWTGDGRIRHPAYLGMRDDRSPAEVVRESASFDQ
jgi:bifunctional non-homologous end joining protein LigD